MGMFASANSGDTRFVRIYLETGKGDREPIVQFTTSQQDMLQGALWYPTRGNFQKLARSLRHTTFVAAKECSPVYFYNAAGEAVRPMDRSHRLLRTHGQRSVDDADWTLLIEYWEMSYDPATQKAKISLVETMRFDKEASS